jgi:hypothetical protein
MSLDLLPRRAVFSSRRACQSQVLKHPYTRTVILRPYYCTLLLSNTCYPFPFFGFSMVISASWLGGPIPAMSVASLVVAVPYVH